MTTMKKYYIAMSIAALGLTFSSCEEKLDIPQKSVLELNDYYGNATVDEAEALIASAYKMYWGGRDVTCANGIEKILFLNSLDDDHFTGGGSFADATNQYQEAGSYNVTSTDFAPKLVYKGIYSVIYHCNLILEKIPETTDAGINRIKAEANALRSIAMFDAVRWWGTPPLADHVLGMGEYYQENTETKTSIDWILANLKDAADQLPALSAKGTQEKFGARLSKHAVLALRGKVGLWYATRYKDNSYLADAVKDLQQVVNSKLYGLVSDMFILERPAGDFCEEYVWEHNSADNDGMPNDPQNDLRHMWTGWPDGLKWPADRAAGTNGPDDPGFYKETYTGWGWNAVSGDFGDFLKAHEGGTEKPRFKSTIHTYEQVLEMGCIGVGPAGICHNQGYFTYRGIAFNKDFYDNPGTFWRYAKTNAAMMRYAEVLLLYAEAKFLADGDADKTGLAALNEVRTRAELEPVAALTYDIIKGERRAELFYEQERFFDLQRWGDAPTALANKGKQFYQFFGYKPGTTEYDVRTVEGKGKGWQDKYMLLPFPFEQISANPNLKQNTGW